MRTRVKICGITNLKDAVHAVEAGADALGFIFVPETPRYIDPSDAANIIGSIPPFISTVGVFKDEEKSKVQRFVIETGITYIQLHGIETPEYCEEFSLPVIKVFEFNEKSNLSILDSYNVNAHLVDKPKSKKGTANWNVAVSAKRYSNRLILAGGLTPENVSEAIRYVKPYAVDVASGVEYEKGRKDHCKMNLFIQEVRKTETTL
ncbi:phosphoribosylanthranilate isomerase [Candidatus Poribacteria bacterium]|nr:MAG: phosphoribosylanthranilate isomerase [Candidatus Poribacteria bacterium]